MKTIFNTELDSMLRTAYAEIYSDERVNGECEYFRDMLLPKGDG